LPWRFTPFEGLRADTWSLERVREFAREAADFIATASIFLRHIRQVSVFENEKLTRQVRYGEGEKQSHGQFWRRSQRQEITESNENTYSREWNYYSCENQAIEPENCTVKERTVT